MLKCYFSSVHYSDSSINIVQLYTELIYYKLIKYGFKENVRQSLFFHILCQESVSNSQVSFT